DLRLLRNAAERDYHPPGGADPIRLWRPGYRYGQFLAPRRSHGFLYRSRHSWLVHRALATAGARCQRSPTLERLSLAFATLFVIVLLWRYGARLPHAFRHMGWTGSWGGTLSRRTYIVYL